MLDWHWLKQKWNFLQQTVINQCEIPKLHEWELYGGFLCVSYPLEWLFFLHWFAKPNTTLLLYPGLGPAMLRHDLSSSPGNGKNVLLKPWPLILLGFISSLHQLAWDKRLCCCCKALWRLILIKYVAEQIMASRLILNSHSYKCWLYWGHINLCWKDTHTQHIYWILLSNENTLITLWSYKPKSEL